MTIVTVPGAADAGAIYPDGSPARFELNATGGAGWIIHLSGGGWRFMNNGSRPLGFTRDGTPDAAGGSSCYGICDGIMSNDAGQNPRFHGFNKIFIPISGTSFTGDRTSPTPYPVRGARILRVVIEHLQAARGMGAATDVILTGGSSGGLATYLNCDRVGAMVAAANSSTRYACLADAGYFLDHAAATGAPSTSPLFRESFYAWNSSGATNQAPPSQHSTAVLPPPKSTTRAVAPPPGVRRALRAAGRGVEVHLRAVSAHIRSWRAPVAHRCAGHRVPQRSMAYAAWRERTRGWAWQVRAAVRRLAPLRGADSVRLVAAQQHPQGESRPY